MRSGVSVRRRTEAFTWSRGMYRQWVNGGACWLDRDPKGGNDDDGATSVTALQHVYSSFTATAENQNGKSGAPGSSKEDDRTNNSVLREGDLQQNRNNGGDRNSGKNSDQCLHDSAKCCKQKTISDRNAATEKESGPRLPGSYSTCSKNAEMRPEPGTPL